MQYHIPVARSFGSKFLECPLLKYFRNVGLEYPLPPKKNENLGRSWHFGFELVFSIPPESENLGRSWHFGFGLQ